MSSTKKVVLALAVVGFLIVLGWPSVRRHIDSHSKYAAAIYPTYEFHEVYPEFYRFVATDKSGKLPDLYLELPDGSVFALKDLPVNEVQGVLPKVQQYPNQTFYSDETVLAGESSSVGYEKGKPFMISLHASNRAFRIGAKREGPFIALPIDRNKLISMFGEPSEWREVPPPAPRGL